ncbi:aminotransferase class IV [Chondrocystis sp. NIES-4102]|nr:aminotransferase class IV [Chondrocystis sp. NIES-4102]
MYWYDGSLVNSNQLQLSINEPGFIYGANVFSTMRIYENSLQHPLTAWQAHCDRLNESIQVFKWQQPNWTRLRQGAELLTAYFPILRLVIFPDGKEWITGRNLPPDLKQRQTRGITAWIATERIYRRSLAEYKTGNYLAAYLARNQALKHNAQEAILIDHQGNWLETSTGNLWGWKNHCWYTPSLDLGILPGIARSHFFSYLNNQQFQVQENIWTPNFSEHLEAIFYTNCVVGIIPIKMIINGDHQQIYPVKTVNWQDLFNKFF